MHRELTGGRRGEEGGVRRTPGAATQPHSQPWSKKDGKMYREQRKVRAQRLTVDEII